MDMWNKLCKTKNLGNIPVGGLHGLLVELHSFK